MKKHHLSEQYKPLLIPINKPFDELNKTEANNYYHWFLSHIDERSEYLFGYISNDTGNKTVLAYSFESTIPIWRWFLKNAEIIKTPEIILRQMRKSLEGHPDSFIEHMIEQAKMELSTKTEYILRDMGMYISKVFMLKSPSLSWTIQYTPKSFVHVNMPLIEGFIDDNPLYPKPFYPKMEPIDFVRTPAMNLFYDTSKDTDLFDMCMQWAEWMPK